uniref:Uncharacterized protein n=1 Tax=Timema cristinae TaxID=61476 RepID=A0A7R9DD90_TIMCR|nr:unnamed protein product [Timema cristinae]
MVYQANCMDMINSFLVDAPPFYIVDEFRHDKQIWDIYFEIYKLVFCVLKRLGTHCESERRVGLPVGRVNRASCGSTEDILGGRADETAKVSPSGALKKAQRGTNKKTLKVINEPSCKDTTPQSLLDKQKRLLKWEVQERLIKARGPKKETHLRPTDNPMLRGYDVHRTDKSLFDRASGGNELMDQAVHLPPEACLGVMFLGLKGYVRRGVLVTWLEQWVSTPAQNKLRSIRDGNNFMSPELLGDLLYKNYILTIPTLLDMCLLYGRDCHSDVADIISTIFIVQPAYFDDLQATVAFIIKTLKFVEWKFGTSTDVVHHSDIIKLSSVIHRGALDVAQFRDLVIHVLDTAATLSIFLGISQPACEVFHHQLFELRGQKRDKDKGIICTDPTMTQVQFHGLLTEANTAREA